MKLVVEIPKEFECDWSRDKFYDCFERVLVDLGEMCLVSGRYEKETIKMLESAFHDAKEYPVVDVGDINDLPSVVPAPKKCHNLNTDYAECDQFVCSNCGIELQDWHSVERDEDNGDITYHDYEFKYCPNCGAKIGGEE